MYFVWMGGTWREHTSGAKMSFGDNWVLNHVGMTVGDRNAVLRYYQTHGLGVSVGPQPLLPHEEGEGSLMFYQTLEGDPITNTYRTGGAHNFKDGECQIGDCQLECFPMRPGPGKNTLAGNHLSDTPHP